MLGRGTRSAHPSQLGLYNAAYSVRKATVASALALADLIAAVEAAEQADPEAPELAAYRQKVSDGLVELRREIEGWDSTGDG